MTVTYDETLADDVSRVRLRIGDTTEDSGPRPDAAVLAAQGGWSAAVYDLLETLATEWSTYANWQAGPRSEQASQIANRFAERAKTWREQYAISPASGVGARHVTRVDGYSDDIASDTT
jgi:hypothetical protein